MITLNNAFSIIQKSMGDDEILFGYKESDDKYIFAIKTEDQERYGYVNSDVYVHYVDKNTGAVGTFDFFEFSDYVREKNLVVEWRPIKEPEERVS